MSALTPLLSRLMVFLQGVSDDLRPVVLSPDEQRNRERSQLNREAQRDFADHKRIKEQQEASKAAELEEKRRLIEGDCILFEQQWRSMSPKLSLIKQKEESASGKITYNINGLKNQTYQVVIDSTKKVFRFNWQTGSSNTDSIFPSVEINRSEGETKIKNRLQQAILSKVKQLSP